METYKNGYKKTEDEMLWELHEIRHDLHDYIKLKNIEEINNNAKSKYQSWIESSLKIKQNSVKA